MPLFEKVRRPRVRPPQPTPKELRAWEAFVQLAEAQIAPGKEPPQLVSMELQRLCARGNPLALRFKERLSIAEFKPRTAGEVPATPLRRPRLGGISWLPTPLTRDDQ